MSSETTLVNAALERVSGDLITSLDDGSVNANRVLQIYPDLRDDLLASNDWSFAAKRVQLAQLADAPAFEFDYAYALPSDWLRTIAVHDNDAGVSSFPYRQENQDGIKVLLASREAVYLRYVYRLEDPTYWSASFRMAVIYALARDLSLPIASSNAMEARFAQKANAKLAQARSIDSMGSFPVQRPIGSWALSRGGRRFGVNPSGTA